MGGIYGDKPSTLARFKENFQTRLSEKVKKRLVLENDEVSMSDDSEAVKADPSVLTVDLL